ncbi:MAG: hypothetical protein WC269_01400 [Candidatus Gracilibacteria bacterium]|jgi:hypothetical protein
MEEQFKKWLKEYETDVSPMDEEKRKEYVGRCVVFYKDIFQKQLHHLLYNSYLEIGVIGLSEEQTNFYRGTINALWKLDEFFQGMTQEASQKHENN